MGRVRQAGGRLSGARSRSHRRAGPLGGSAWACRVYLPFLTYSRHRGLREQAYRTYVSRASSGAQDNGGLIETILRLLEQQARRLGYAPWANLSLASKMTGGVAEVERLLEDLRQAALPIAQEELEDPSDAARSATARP